MILRACRSLNSSKARCTSSSSASARSRMAVTSFSAARWRALTSVSLAPSASSSATSSSSSLNRRSMASSSSLRISSSSSASSASRLGRSVVALLLVDPGDEVGGEVDDLLELLGLQLLTGLDAGQQVGQPRAGAAEVPDVHDGGGQLDVAHALAPDLRAGDLDAAALADDALEPDALVLAAVALPVLGRTEDLLAEEAVLLGLERAVVDGLRLLDLAVGPRADASRPWPGRSAAGRSC